jgi:hypothetical protein
MFPVRSTRASRRRRGTFTTRRLEADENRPLYGKRGSSIVISPVFSATSRPSCSSNNAPASWRQMNSSSGVVCATCRDVCDTVIGELSNETKVISSSAAQESLAANVSRQSG